MGGISLGSAAIAQKHPAEVSRLEVLRTKILPPLNKHPLDVFLLTCMFKWPSGEKKKKKKESQGFFITLVQNSDKDYCANDILSSL